MVQKNAGFAIDTEERVRSIMALAYDGQTKPFLNYVSRHIFNRLSNIDLQKFDEKYIKIMLMVCLFQSRVYIPVSETETDSGYIDIYLRRSPLVPDVRYEWIFELKYLKAGEKAIATHRRKALDQLHNYSSSAMIKDRTSPCPLQRGNDLKKAVILFIGKNKFDFFEGDVHV